MHPSYIHCIHRIFIASIVYSLHPSYIHCIHRIFITVILTHSLYSLHSIIFTAFIIFIASIVYSFHSLCSLHSLHPSHIHCIHCIQVYMQHVQHIESVRLFNKTCLLCWCVFDAHARSDPAHHCTTTRGSMRVSDGVLDVVGSCYRSVTPNALLKSRDYSIVWGLPST